VTRATGGVAVVVHSGGPTAVINASLLGVVEEARRHSMITGIYGARNGISGILSEDFIDLERQPAQTLAAVAHAPSSALGTSRREISQADIDRVLEIFRSYDIRFLFYTGGNGSMGTAWQIHKLALESGQAIQVVGIPKTIDNDLLETDHSPGYGSAARFFACAVRDIGIDNRALGGQVEVVEVLGRNVGWIAAATALARHRPDDAPHLIYLPETRLALEKLLEDVQQVYKRLGRCVVVVCEGQLDAEGQPFGADVRAGSRGELAMNLGHRLAMLIAERLKLRTRSEKPGLLGRSSASSVSETDWNGARLCGRNAVLAAVQGRGGSMVTLVRQPSGHFARTDLVELDRVAYRERPFRAEWTNAAGNDILPAFCDYALPLTGEIAHHEQLVEIPVKRRATAPE